MLHRILVAVVVAFVAAVLSIYLSEPTPTAIKIVDSTIKVLTAVAYAGLAWAIARKHPDLEVQIFVALVGLYICLAMHSAYPIFKGSGSVIA